MPDLSQERSLNLPNVITFARLLLSFVVFGLIATEKYWLWAAGLFVFAVLTDVLDGYIARRYNLITVLGRILDPFVDKFITAGVFVFLLPVSHSGVTPLMVMIVLGREMLITSLRGAIEQQGQDFSASISGKLKMFLQCLAATFCMLVLDPKVTEMAPAASISWLRDGLLWLMVLVTVWSGWGYVRRAMSLLNI
jgi:CDP-diacylglycerol---glycerol-3-phosphate 3-phosphatidyltransferase